MITMKMIAPSVRARAMPRFLTKLRVSSSSYAVLIAVIRLATPAEALHRANSTATSAPTPARRCPDNVFSCSMINCRASAGIASVTDSTCVAIVAGSATKP